MFKDLLQAVDRDKVLTRLKELYPEDIDYSEVYENLLSLEPKESELDYLQVEYITEDYSWTDVEIEPESYWDAHAYKDDTCWGISLSPWAELLSLEVRHECPPEDAVAHLIWEMTFHGFTEETVQEFTDMLDSRVDDIKSGKTKGIPWEEVKKKIQDKIKDR
tara:strand:+ start:154 stop:639 length:486 start_codon:yes stop_codon:yes gene_type:complete